MGTNGRNCDFYDLALSLYGAFGAAWCLPPKNKYNRTTSKTSPPQHHATQPNRFKLLPQHHAGTMQSPASWSHLKQILASPDAWDLRRDTSCWFYRWVDLVTVRQSWDFINCEKDGLLKQILEKKLFPENFYLSQHISYSWFFRLYIAVLDFDLHPQTTPFASQNAVVSNDLFLLSKICFFCTMEYIGVFECIFFRIPFYMQFEACILLLVDAQVHIIVGIYVFEPLAILLHCTKKA